MKILTIDKELFADDKSASEFFDLLKKAVTEAQGNPVPIYKEGELLGNLIAVDSPLCPKEVQDTGLLYERLHLLLKGNYETWMQAPNKAFDNRKPIELLESDNAEGSKALWRMVDQLESNVAN